MKELKAYFLWAKGHKERFLRDIEGAGFIVADNYIMGHLKYFNLYENGTYKKYQARVGHGRIINNKDDEPYLIIYNPKNREKDGASSVIHNWAIGEILRVRRDHSKLVKIARGFQVSLQLLKEFEKSLNKV